MDNKPKLLLAADTYYPKVDGTLRFMEEFIKRAQKDFEISLLVPNLGEKKGQRVTYLQPSKRLEISGYPSMKLSFQNLRKVKKAIKDADLVFIQGPAVISYLSIFYGNRYKKKTFFYTHTIAWELFEKFFPPILNKLFFRIIKKASIFCYNRCTEIFVPYHELRNYLKKAGVKTDISVTRLGVDISRFTVARDKQDSKKKIGIEPEKKVIGYVGRISKEKNIQVLLQAFKKLKDQKQLHLLLVGDGPKDQVKDFEKIKNCTITGFVSNVQDYLKAMDIFVMPSLTETTSLATLEAMSSGIPVIVTKVGFMRDYIVKNHNGLFFPRNSSTMLATKMRGLLDDEELRERLGSKARKTVAYGFSWERSINKIKRLLLKQYLKI